MIAPNSLSMIQAVHNTQGVCTVFGTKFKQF